MKMIYLDKNYPPSEIKLTLQAINEVAKDTNASLKLVAMIPDVARNNQCMNLPFSTTFLAQCYLRCLERQGHFLMPSDDPERILRIILLFSQQFKKVQFNDNLKREFGFDEILRMQFTLEHEDFELPRKLDNLLQRLVS